MKPPSVVLLAFGLLVRAASAQTTKLGSVTFGTPLCGGIFANGTPINNSDCMAAVNQMFAAHCASGSCNILPLAQSAESGFAQSVGTCTTSVTFALGGNGATFYEAPVRDAFPQFIAECVEPGSGDTDNFPILVSTNGALNLVFSTSGPTGGG
jgi:hypothetical protein